MKLIIVATVVHELDVAPEHLQEYYKASTIQEAAQNQTDWFHDSPESLQDVLDGTPWTACKVIGVA